MDLSRDPLFLAGVHPICCLLGFAGSREDRPGIMFQKLEPGGDIGGVVWTGMMRNAQVSQDVTGRQLGDSLFQRPRVIAKSLAKIAVEPVLGPGGMPLMPISA